MRAGEYLDQVIHDAQEGVIRSFTNTGSLPHRADSGIQTQIARAPCQGVPCILETTLAYLPQFPTNVATSATEMLALESGRRGEGGQGMEGLYFMNQPPSAAVDGLLHTPFCSKVDRGALALDFLASQKWGAGVEMAWLVDARGEALLKSARFEASMDGVRWKPNVDSERRGLVCVGVTLSGTADEAPLRLRKCSVIFEFPSDADSARVFRAHVEDDRGADGWCVYEIWMQDNLSAERQS